MSNFGDKFWTKAEAARKLKEGAKPLDLETLNRAHEFFEFESADMATQPEEFELELDAWFHNQILLAIAHQKLLQKEALHAERKEAVGGDAAVAGGPASADAPPTDATEKLAGPGGS